ncbi:30S ribosomal protein S12 methylthiotransferase RimO [Helicobacter ailurogastricus]|uniref:Ribosomal protein uS12 methylthiotransferase RimO n=1 Tax=Helicobacter ailurogastricus TaxID=1578720 RepID=A0A0K2X866_9HELI|nr:30S ribosomal protein S12 methylthiotransferase RimO [Helicobacter ailurogastricus]CRF40592.1 Ribosomal protein S12p Asp88 (E. coli) methylthiotransferase [Helicobacter ailurogastricus]CRF42246.1 Ribosomal protein S12p Asp88 (E. coli) methylthiotransferase [Helicobacter ailurogastricus]CRF44198.1 Ribosomal protein S12p Asp88 (E. coli) methylthiotransferase [Helicobacter ailurogastricus]
MPKLHLISLGCSKNLVDSEVMLGKLAHYELTSDLSAADAIIVNTCGFIQSAKEESIRVLLEAIGGRKKGALVVASGCLSARYQEELAKELPEIDIFTGVGDYDKIDMLLAKKQSQFSKQVFLASQHARTIIGSSVHAYVKLSEGCNQNCSFCAIPSFKGRLQSKSIESILSEVEELAKRGYVDISFIAQDSSSYLQDRGVKEGLTQLIKAIDKQGAIKSARIFYLYPTSTTLKLIEAIANSPIFANYFDMPIQHISDSMLKTMRRNSTKAKHLELLEAMRAVPNSFLRSTLLLGHPHEQERDIDELQEFLEGFTFDRLNLFAFSAEEGTRAYGMPQIAPKLVNARIDRINALVQKQVQMSMQALVGQTLEVIVEGASEDNLFLRARDKRWGLEIDGEILINESSLEHTPPGHYKALCTTCQEGMLVGKVVA